MSYFDLFWSSVESAWQLNSTPLKRRCEHMESFSILLITLRERKEIGFLCGVGKSSGGMSEKRE